MNYITFEFKSGKTVHSFHLVLIKGGLPYGVANLGLSWFLRLEFQEFPGSSIGTLEFQVRKLKFQHRGGVSDGTAGREL